MKLEQMGVEVRLGHAVELVDAEGVVVNGERIRSGCVIWAAGVSASPAGKWLGAETDRAGRVKVKADLTVPNHPEIFVVGDTAFIEEDGQAAARRGAGGDSKRQICRARHSPARAERGAAAAV